jgi:hypothetical protein
MDLELHGADNERKYFPENFGRKASDGSKDSFMDVYGFQEICTTELEGGYGFVKQCNS